MNLSVEFESIRVWAHEKGIYEKGDAKTQTIKLFEEAGELAKAVINNDIDEISDAIGDCAVVLVSLAHLCGLRFEDCVNGAYSVIKNRTGRMDNGSFIKDKP